MSGYVWMCLYRQDSEYALDLKYAKILAHGQCKNS